MDTKSANEERVLREATVALEAPGLSVQVKQGPHSGGDSRRRADMIISVEHGNQRIEYRPKVKRNLRPATLGALIQQLRMLYGRPLLVADYITPPMAERLRELGVEFIDTAGNAWLHEPPLWIWVSGRRQQETAESKPQPTGRAFQASGLRVLFALLCKPEIVDRPYREIARLAGVAHGTVGWVMAELPKLGYTATYRKKRVLVKPERLLIEWAEAYARTLSPKLLLATFSTDDTQRWIEQDATKFGFNLSGEVAGARVTGYLKPATITLYGDDLDSRFLLRFQLRKAKQGNVEIMKRFWAFDVKEPLAPEPLIYADLLATGDTRCIETAALIYEKLVDGFQKADRT